MKHIALIALATLAFTAHADEADGSQHALKFTSQRSTAEVQAEAMNPVRIGNGGTGYIGLTQSSVDAATVKAQALQAARRGETSRGELGTM